MVNLETPPTKATTAKNSLSLVYRDSDQTLPQKLFQPLNLAVVASIILHGVVGYGAPALPFLQRPSAPREVKIMQLTAQEQSRIRRDEPPRPPAVTGVPIPNAPSQGTTINPGSPNTFPTNTFPNNSINTSPRVSGFPTYVPDNGTTFVPANPRQYGNFDSGVPEYTIIPNTTPPNPRNEQRQAVATPREPLAPTLRTPPSEQFVAANNFSVGNRSVFNRPFVTTPSAAIPSPTTAVPSPSPSPSPTTPASPSNNDNGDNSGNPPVAINPTPTPTSSSNSSNSNGSTGQPTATPQVPPPIAFNPNNTDPTTDLLSSNFASFLGNGNEELLDRNKQVEIILDNVKYPLNACVQKLEGTAVLGVITDAGGAINKGPEVLKSSGYDIFNEVAIAAANAYNLFTPAKAYIITVPFVYSQEACPSVSNTPATDQGTQDPNPIPDPTIPATTPPTPLASP